MGGVGDWLTERTNSSGKRTAIISNDQRFTYEELNRRVNCLANGLLQLGVAKGDRVAVFLFNGNEMIETIFACAKIGAICLPINIRLSRPEVDFIISDGTVPKALIYCKSFPAMAEIDDVKIRHKIQVGGMTKGMEYESFLAANPAVEPMCNVDEEDTVLLVYTSGTTGTPKGAMLTHGNIRWTVEQALRVEPLMETDVTLTVAPLFHVAALTILTMPLLRTGGTVIAQAKFEPVDIIETIEREKVSCFFMVPCMWQSIMPIIDSGRHDISSVRFGVTAGAVCSPEIILYYQAKGIPLIQVLGMTEIPIISMLKARDAARKAGSVGQPLVDISIVSSDHTAHADKIGELLVQGPSLMKGYWNRVEEMQAAVQDGWLHTGDIVRVDQEGYIYVAGRKKEMIISGGENIYPAEVEHILERHPKIKEVAVVGIPDETWGETVKAVVVLKDNSASFTLEDVRSYCKGILANYKIPKVLQVVNALPRNSMGKLIKQELKAV